MDSSDIDRLEAQVFEMARVLSAQADAIAGYAALVELLVDRRSGDRRQEDPGIGGVPGLDRREVQRRG